MRMPLRKRTRYERAKRAVREMLPKRARVRKTKEQAEPALTQPDYSALHWLTAGLFVAAGTEAALGERRGDYRSDPIRWAPFIAAPLAGAAQAARALWPSPTTKVVAQLVNGVALGVGAAGLASSVSAAIQEHKFADDDYAPSLAERMPSFAPLAFGAVGLLGLLLDSEEDGYEEEEEDDDDEYVERTPPRRRKPPRRIIVRL